MYTALLKQNSMLTQTAASLIPPVCRNIVEGVLASGTRKLSMKDERLFLVGIQTWKPVQDREAVQGSQLL